MNMAAAYLLQNCATGRVFEDSGWLLSDPHYQGHSLIRALYHKKQLDYSDHGKGFYRFADWLPVKRILPNSAAPITYKSEGLARHIGLKNLYITFSGYWPERGAFMKTCSFKETEAYSVCAHIPEGEKRTMVVASAETPRVHSQRYARIRRFPFFFLCLMTTLITCGLIQPWIRVCNCFVLLRVPIILMP